MPKGIKGFQKGQKFSEEHKRKLSLANMGEKNPNKRPENKEKIRRAMIGNKNGFKVGDKGYWLGKERSIEDRKKIGQGLLGKYIGKNACNWKGGITLLEHQIRQCFQYRQWRSDVFTKDDFTCQECGNKGCYLEAHHIKRFSNILEEYQIKTLEEALNCEELWNINNGRTLCQKCHNKTKGKRK